MVIHKSQIETPTESYVVRYPWAVDMAIEQQDIFWPAHELGVEEDEQDFRVELNDAERHGMMVGQRIVTRYELTIGGDSLWGGKIPRMFPRHEIQRLCACIANVELNSHAPFYVIGNQMMGLDTDEFYESWQEDVAMRTRLEFIGKSVSSDCPLLTTAALAFIEGAMLYVILGFFKGFNCRGHNMLSHFVSGIDGSAKDENFHSLASAALFTQCRAERIAAGNHSEEEDEALSAAIDRMAAEIHAHEMLIADRMFEIPGNRVVTKAEVIDFFEDRMNIVLGRLGRPPMFDKSPGTISGWFYEQLSTMKVPDVFANTQLQYRRSWRRDHLVFDMELANGI